MMNCDPGESSALAMLLLVHARGGFCVTEKWHKDRLEDYKITIEAAPSACAESLR